MFYIFFLISISLILSYLILTFIYRILFKSKKKVSKFLVFLGSIGLIIFYYTPYSFYLEPSYHEFKKVCKLNKLPNNEEKYNKILSYFDTSLDTLDWEELNGRTWKIPHDRRNYVKGKLEYRVEVTEVRKKRYNISVDLYTNNKGLSKENITYIQTYGTWHTNRYYFEITNLMSYYGDLWVEKELSCTNIAPLKYDYAERIK